METATSAGSSLAEALFGKSTRADEVWQEVRFDSPLQYLECRRGEVVLESLVRTFCWVLHAIKGHLQLQSPRKAKANTQLYCCQAAAATSSIS